MISEAEKVQQFAKEYVALVEALQHAGVREDIARAEARIAAMVHLTMLDEKANDSPCPLCGR